MDVVRNTWSVCPVCLTRLAATVVKRGGEYFLEKNCPVHGLFSTVVWRGDTPSYEEWGSGYTAPAGDAAIPDCPGGCGLCPGHLQKTCCALVEVTRRCNLNCPVCFAQSGECLPGHTGAGETAQCPPQSGAVAADPIQGGSDAADPPDPPLDVLYRQFRRLVKDGNTFVQLSGGEPTVRGDLADIVAAAKEAGCENIQLNTNGLRLGEDRRLAKSLREAGLSFVFMQFDGTMDEIYRKLRGKPLLAEKTAAIKNCADAFLGVTLVPTLVPGVNDNNIGGIIDYGISNSPAVRGVHFQPVSYLGRYPGAPGNKDRITLPELLRAIEAQSGGKLKIHDFAPSRCDHPYCGFHGDFAVLPKNKLLKLTPKKSAPCCGGDEHIRNRNFVSRRWNRSGEGEDCGGGSGDYTELDAFASRIKSHGFTITAMAFQDAYNLDIERLRRCSLHVSEDGKMMPFCAKYLTGGAVRRNS